MTAFTNFIKQQTTQTNNEQQERFQPNNPILRLSQKEPQLYLRILPGIEGNGFNFFKEFRSTFINFTKKDGSVSGAPVTLPATVGTSVFDTHISNWVQNEIKFSRFPGFPNRRYYINAIPMIQNNGALEYKKDASGQPLVHPVELTVTLFKALGSKLEDSFLSPSGEPEAPLSFISENRAFVVGLSRKGQGTDTSYDVNVYTQNELGQLPSNWRELATDLDKLAQPLEEANPDFANFLINSINGTPGQDNFPNGKPEPVSFDVEEQMPSNITTQQSVQQETNPFQGAEDINDEEVPFTAPVQQQPVQQTQPQQQAPVQESQPKKEAQNQAEKDVSDILSGLGVQL